MAESPKPAQVLADVQQTLAAHPFVVLLLDHMRSALAPHDAEIKKRMATRAACGFRPMPIGLLRNR